MRQPDQKLLEIFADFLGLIPDKSEGTALTFEFKKDGAGRVFLRIASLDCQQVVQEWAGTDLAALVGEVEAVPDGMVYEDMERGVPDFDSLRDL